MSEGTKGKTGARQRLLAELDQLEQERRALNLRDRQAVEEWERKIEVLRRKINAFDPLRRRTPNLLGGTRQIGFP